MPLGISVLQSHTYFGSNPAPGTVRGGLCLRRVAEHQLLKLIQAAGAQRL